jgi:NADH-quinone oxidoreductase subunit J
MNTTSLTVFEPLIFYGFAGLLLLASLLVVASRNPVRSALSLVLCFFASAILWLSLRAEFLALILVLVYVGAVMTLFLFVIMMLDLDRIVLQGAFAKYWPFALMLAAVLLGIIIYALLPTYTTLEPASVPMADYSNTKELGSVLYTQYGYAFELAAVLLLIAIIAAISLAFRGRKPSSKAQDAAQQIQVKRHERVRLVEMAAEKKNT